MSQHIVCVPCAKSNGLVRVQLGWDKPMAEFYLVVFAEPPAGQQYSDERIIYSNLDDPRSHAQELGYFKGGSVNWAATSRSLCGELHTKIESSTSSTKPSFTLRAGM